ncbi:heme ABC transporter ATP-binding protein [Serinibacter arcticus]|uniref:Heme ABC transporter ATP-binding protein n=1 Tax=Serinibacter arcticus TaxID=1655435 RepID=A0A2U1ZZS3_9MICO|nr:heme ABC transporter ATP-binding protein [Serinibacter arcticus]PWD52487.1 heme ABC transporter ATP-binding protein [Serinibacter arcticus]
MSARGVRVVLGGSLILDDVDLEVRPGELTALVGPNGAGKSTLLAVLAGDLDPAAGTVEVTGRELRRTPVRDLARVRAVQVQESQLSFSFTATEVVAMGRAPWQGTPSEDDDDAVVAASMRRADVTHLAARRFPSLSGGEKARTSFARALAQDTRVLLLDEPTAALDIRHQEALLTEVTRLVADGAAVVVVLHDLSLAGAYADRVVLLRGGRVRADGTPHEVLTAELLTEVYEHPVDVIHHPDSPGPVVLPVRAHRRPGAAGPVVTDIPTAFPTDEETSS